MSDPEFTAAVLDIRARCQHLRSIAPSVDQLTGLGAELQAQQEEIIEIFRQKGLMYSMAPWV